MQAGRDRLEADQVWCGGVVWLEAIRGRSGKAPKWLAHYSTDSDSRVHVPQPALSEK